VCDESALALHELIDDIPAAVHIVVPRGTRRPTISYPPTVVAQYAAKTFDLGIERFEAAEGETVPMYNAARSVVDAIRHRSRIGETLALHLAATCVEAAVTESANSTTSHASWVLSPSSALPLRRCSPDGQPHP
jgi:predicted transcriptional regulator of viral defense system